MVMGLLAVAAIPTVVGVGQAVGAQKKQNAAAREQKRFNMAALLPSEGGLQETRICVLADGRQEKLLLDLPGQKVEGHRFCGYYFTYPGLEQHLGLVSTISDDPPMLNWIYVDSESGAVRYGGRKDTLGGVIGPWGWSQDGTLLTLDGQQGGFVAREETNEGGLEAGEAGGEARRWAVYWDGDKNMPTTETGTAKALLLRRRPVLGLESRYTRPDAQAAK